MYSPSFIWCNDAYAIMITVCCDWTKRVNSTANGKLCTEHTWHNIAPIQHTDSADNENESSVQSNVSNQENVSTFELEYLLTLFGY